MSFTIVHLKEENSIEGVPSSWVIKVNNKTFCYWPPINVCARLTSLIKRCASPDISWKLSKCSVLFKADSYSEMREKCKEAEYLSGSEATEREQSAESEVACESDSYQEFPSSPKKKKLKTNNYCQIELEEKNSDLVTLPITNSVSEMKLEMIDLYNKMKTIEEQNNKILKVSCEIFKSLIDTKEEVKILKDMIRENNVPVSLEKSTKLPNLPIQTANDLLQLEAVLQDDSEKHHLTLKLSNYGGSHLRSTVNNIMKNALAHSVATLYSMQGKGTKLSFMELRFCSCVQEAILLTPLGKGAPLCDINKYIAIYLTQAKDKISRRNRPRYRVQEKENSGEMESGVQSPNSSAEAVVDDPLNVKKGRH